MVASRARQDSTLDTFVSLLSNPIRMIRPTVTALILASLATTPLAAEDQEIKPPQPRQEKAVFAFEDGDRIVLVGNTIFEREQRYGCFEPRLALALGDANISVRNLAWSADTVFGHARSYFGPPEEGLQRLTGHLDLLKPSVVMLCYGSEFAFEKLGGLPDFLTGYRNLLELIRKHAPGARIVIISPPPLETLPPPLPDQTDANKSLSSFRDALRKFAASQNTWFIDLFELMGGVPKPGTTAKPLTENGVHYTLEGYERIATKLVEGLGLTPPSLPPAELETIRRDVVAKDQLFFNRWRPQNETYLFGFRKHEQGQNAKEIPMFDPLIEQADHRIQTAKNNLIQSKKRL
jgi:lysophospholipase L1-like esterase